MSESTSDWLTVAQAAKLIGISERAARRLIDAPENAARTRQQTRRTATRTRQATILDPKWVASLANEYRQNTAPIAADTPANDGTRPANGGEHGANTGEKSADDGRNAAQDGATVADTALALSNFDTRIARLEGALVQQIATSLDERLSALPTKEDMNTAIQQAAQQVAIDVAQDCRVTERVSTAGSLSYVEDAQARRHHRFRRVHRWAAMAFNRFVYSELA